MQDQAETINGIAQINDAHIDTISANTAVRRSEPATKPVTANPNEPSPPINQAVSISPSMWDVGGCFDIFIETNEPAMSSICAKDSPNETQLGPRFDHHFAFSTVIITF
jgi:hypothetical protein